MILADFHKIGNIPVLMILLIIMLNGREIFSPQSSIIRPEMLSGPCALLIFKRFMISKINLRLTIMVPRFELVI